MRPALRRLCTSLQERELRRPRETIGRETCIRMFPTCTVLAFDSRLRTSSAAAPYGSGVHKPPTALSLLIQTSTTALLDQKKKADKDIKGSGCRVWSNEKRPGQRTCLGSSTFLKIYAFVSVRITNEDRDEEAHT
jgi:hypothetical protein